METLVNLNVGGIYFVTRRSTLSAVESFFSGIVETHPDCTELFIDRDPTHFRYILNWLRGVRVLPDDDMTLRELMWEADYYCMTDMLEAITTTKTRFSLNKSLHDISVAVQLR